MVHLNGSLERVTDSVAVKFISRVVMPLLVAALTVISGIGLDWVMGMEKRIGDNEKTLSAHESDIRNIETIRIYNIQPRLKIVEDRVQSCCYSPRPEREERGP